MRSITQLTLVVVVSGLVGCSGGSQTLPLGNKTPIAPIENYSQIGTPLQYAQGFPSSLPQDRLQPWEKLGADGKVCSATRPSTEFFEGPQAHFESGDTSAWNGALRIASGAVGDGNLSYAMYRIPLGGSDPGVVSVDANLRPMSDGDYGGYYVGLADYGAGRWQWFGPVTDSHWRISAVLVAGENTWYDSDLGNLFLCIAVDDGAVIDVVGVGVDPSDDSDITEPDAPGWMDIEPVAGGFEVYLDPVGGNDVAGYQVYYQDSSFGEFTADFANTLQCLQGRSFILDLSGTAIKEYWVAVRAIDYSGNESALGEVLHAAPLAGSPPALELETSTYSTQKGSRVILTASGADLYDWDLDGDGIFDILDDETGTADVDTSQTGLIRPLVLGFNEEGTSVALSAVSVMVSGNSRPVAFASATPSNGNAPLLVDFSGTESTDFDGSIVGGGWDFDGDGIFDIWDDTDIVHVTSAQYSYTDPGLFNAKLRVVDDAGAWDVDTVTVMVSGNLPPVATITSALECQMGESVTFDAQQSFDLDGTIVQYEWDLDGNGSFETDSTPAFWAVSVFDEPGYTEVGLQVTDDQGAQGMTAILLTVHGTSPIIVDSAGSVGRDTSLAVVNGFPAISYYDNTNADLKYVRANDASGAAWGLPATLDSAGSVGEYTSLAVVDGNPAISYLDTSSANLIFIRANDANGSSWGAPRILDSIGVVGLFTSLAVVNGNPAISYYDDTNQNLKYIRANNADGTAWGAPVTPDSAGSVGRYTSLAVVSGMPAISYYDISNGDLKYVHASNAGGTAWETPVSVDSAGDVGGDTSMAIVDGNPAISYYDFSNSNLKYVRATEANGAFWGNPVTPDSTGSVGQFTSLAVVSGKPAISYYDDTSDDLKFVQASDVGGSSWDVPVTLDSTGSLGNYSSLAVVKGNPAISYFDRSNFFLKYLVVY